MENNAMMDIIKVTGICPILASSPVEDAPAAAQALVKGGLPVLEVLIKNEESWKNIESIAKQVPEIILGAGTVLTLDSAKRAKDLGAKFLVMPGMSEKIVEFALKNGMIPLPGCVTATEIMMALDYGIHTVKFFPIYQMGGTDTLNQYTYGPFPTVNYVVTGGLGSGNFLPLLEGCKNTLACGGDWMFTDHDALKNRDFAQIAANMRDSVLAVQDMRNAKNAR